MQRTWSFAVVLVPLVLACGGARTAESPAPHAATASAITPEDLRTRIGIFADDSMLGRRSGTTGNSRGNAYIAAELARLKLRPAGDSGGFLQRVPLVSWTIDTTLPPLRAGATALTVFRDYFPYQPTFDVPVRPLEGAPTVYVGTLADSGA